MNTSAATELGVEVEMTYSVPAPAEMLLQIEAAEGGAQRTDIREFEIAGAKDFVLDAGHAEFGARSRFLVEDQITCRYRAKIIVERPEIEWASLDHTPLTRLPEDTLRFLMPSRYCQPELFEPDLEERFGSLKGGAFISACNILISRYIRYTPGASGSETTAWDTFHQREGICRDYAHVLISMARARGIPARFVSCFAPEVAPQDFHAVAEVWLGGDWHLIDPTGMAGASDTVRIASGLDAADVAFLTIFGRAEMVDQRVHTRRLDA